MKKRILSLCIFLLWYIANNAQSTYNYQIKWQDLKFEEGSSKEPIYFLNFDGALYSDDQLPVFSVKLELTSGTKSISVNIEKAVFETISQSETSKVKNLDKINSNIVIRSSVEFEKKSPKAIISFIPLRKNPKSGLLEKLISFQVKLNQENAGNQKLKNFSYASNSVLSQGEWYKIAVMEDGIHKLNYSALKNLGLNIDSIDPARIQIFGNGGQQLSYSNAAFRYDDLQENAIEIKGESDHRFDSSDYILFYGQGTTKWKYSNADKHFHHQLHCYSDTNFYFITAGNVNGKRIQIQNSSNLPATDIVTTFDDFAFHEKEAVNFIKTGRNWYGESFGIVDNFSLSFNFPNIDLNALAYLKADVVVRSFPAATFNVNCQSATLNLSPASVNTSCYYCDYALGANSSAQFQPSSPLFNVNIKFNKPSVAAESNGWLNYIELNTRRLLQMTGNQMIFRDAQSVGVGKIAQFKVSNLTAGDKIWDITDILNIKEQQIIASGVNHIFTLPTDSLKEFIAFTGTEFLQPIGVGKIPNQNLHAYNDIDFLIVSYPEFLSEAKKLADFHRQTDSLSALVTTPQEIYNEFSSGMQDPSAIKHFAKMFYDKAGSPDKLPQYLLLLGDGSYDNRTRSTSNNSNFIPTYQSDNSTDPTKSFTTDDFYGLLDDNEGDGLSELMDIGVGRIPAKTLAEAQAVVNKIIHYESKPTVSNLSLIENGDWRNVVCFIADDQDGNTHISDAETISNLVDSNYRNINIDKIYFDSYKQISTAGGERYPDVTAAINQRMEAGSLIINYTGHGGETGWAHERVIDISTINSWSNFKRLPLFVTATCEFSRYDDPARTSAGEDVLLNPIGGGIGLLTTTRLVYSNPNFVLNNNFYKNAFKPINNAMPRLGDIIEATKNSSVSSFSSNHRNFTLLGDPALRLSYPENTVTTTTLNLQPISIIADTMKALSRITISGFLKDKSGNKLSNFNGVIFPTVFDKSKSITTQSNDSDSPKKSFLLQKNIVYKGRVSVVNGDFTFTFIVPKDIAFNFGRGRLSYYADNGLTDASGYNESFIIGGISDGRPTDKDGPNVNLFMNNEKFISGGLTNESPILLAKIEDENGINTVGNGIGHDIISILDESSDNTYVLNDYYSSELDSYQKGSIRYQLSDLTEGNHTISLRVWDTYNNSSLSKTDFVVSKSSKLALERIFNYPNPFTTRTSFYFQHNQASNGMNVQIQIFTISGKLIKSIDQFVRTEGFSSESIEWDGLDEFGDKIGKGVYIYRLKAIDSNGSKAEKFEKLVILN